MAGEGGKTRPVGFDWVSYCLPLRWTSHLPPTWWSCLQPRFPLRRAPTPGLPPPALVSARRHHLHLPRHPSAITVSQPPVLPTWAPSPQPMGSSSIPSQTHLCPPTRQAHVRTFYSLSHGVCSNKSIESMMLSSISCHPLLPLASIFPSIRFFSKKSALPIR